MKIAGIGCSYPERAAKRATRRKSLIEGLMHDLS